jgi:ubiquinone/menaquinone biosynthesis C-methylase UbiE
LEILAKRIEVEAFEADIEIKQGDCRNMEAINDESVDLIVSNELFCDLNKVGLEKALREFHRVLKPKRRMIHGELIPVAMNKAQELLIEADLNYSLESQTSKEDR